MRKLLAVSLIGLACFCSQAQIGLNTNGPVPQLTLGASLDSALAAITTGSNWIVAPFFTYVRNNQGNGDLYGGGLAGLYNVTPAVGTLIRVDYLDSNFYMVSANVQLQLPFDIFGGKARVTPFGFFGAAAPWGGNKTDAVVGLAGGGWDIKIPKVSSQWSIAFDAEYWSDRPGIQWRIAPFVWKFK